MLRYKATAIQLQINSIKNNYTVQSSFLSVMRATKKLYCMCKCFVTNSTLFLKTKSN